MATWLDDVKQALSNLGGEASLHEIYKETLSIRAVPVTENAEAIIRRTLQEHCPETGTYHGGESAFRSVEGLGEGRWALR